jgi:GT2 family glycosyltransferase
MNIAVLVLTWNAAAVVQDCLRALHAQERLPDTLLVVDNASADDTVAQIEANYPDLWLLQNAHNLGFGQGMNVGIGAVSMLAAPPDIVVLLNQDTIVEPQWLGALEDAFEADAQAGAVGCKICYPDGSLQHAGVELEWPRAVAHHVGTGEPDNGQYDHSATYEAITGAALGLRMNALSRVGLFDSGYSPAYYEDTDLCWRLRQAGYTIRYAPDAVLTHYESLSLRDELTRSRYYNRGRLRFVLKSYSFPDLVGAFAESEQDFIRQHIHSLEANALRWAYIETIVRLPDILQARAAVSPVLTSDEVAAVADMLLTCKIMLASELRQRWYTTLDALRSAIAIPEDNAPTTSV